MTDPELDAHSQYHQTGWVDDCYYCQKEKEDMQPTSTKPKFVERLVERTSFKILTLFDEKGVKVFEFPFDTEHDSSLSLEMPLMNVNIRAISLTTPEREGEKSG